MTPASMLTVIVHGLLPRPPRLVEIWHRQTYDMLLSMLKLFVFFNGSSTRWIVYESGIALRCELVAEVRNVKRGVRRDVWKLSC